MKLIKRDNTGKTSTALSLPETVERMMSDWEPLWPRWSRALSLPSFGMEWEMLPSADFFETEKEILIEMDVPGYDPKKVTVDIDPEMVTVEGKMEEVIEEKEKRYFRRERQTGEFCRQFSLPRYADISKATSKIKDGTLRIRIPKKEEAATKHLKVEVES